MERFQEEHPDLTLVRFPQNRGKRHGMAAAARRATGDIVIYVDSDSFVRRDAFARIVQGFADPEVGAVCGHGKVANAKENFLTKMQEVRYYVAFRIVKSAESLFDTVTCCSGCLAAYRRSYMMDFLDVWLEQKFLGERATFGDDRSLTNFMLRRWRVVYDAGAICETIVPETLSQFFRQQLRWKKSWIRESLLASTFMWKRHPLAAFYFYLGVIFPFVSPAVVFIALVLPMLGVGTFSYLYVYGTLLMAVLYGLVYLVRYKSRMWIYGLAFSLFYMVVLVWQTYYALATVRRNHWGTR
jgi:hyaluronan synthase